MVFLAAARIDGSHIVNINSEGNDFAISTVNKICVAQLRELLYLVGKLDTGNPYHVLESIFYQKVGI